MEKINENERGPIADSYSQLQSLHIIEAARLVYPVQVASEMSLIKSYLQVIEILSFNIINLINRADEHIQSTEIDLAFNKIKWAYETNELLFSIVCKLQDITLIEGEHSYISFSGRKSEIELTKCIASIDASVESKLCVGDNYLGFAKYYQDSKVENTTLLLLEFLRKLAQKIKSWIGFLQNISIPIKIDSDFEYDQFIGYTHLKTAVEGIDLEGDTFFMQFRCFHQVPEIMALELNDRIQFAIENNIFENSNLLHSNEIYYIGDLSDIVLESLKPLISNLTPCDYHKIRENLGLTSGSHSINMHFKLLNEYYQKLASMFVHKVSSDKKYLETAESLIAQRLVKKLSNFTHNWRSIHIQLPINNLGGFNTKSLIGAQDAIETVKKIMNKAKADDPYYQYFQSYERLNHVENIFTEYLENRESLDSKLKMLIGEMTKKRFENVQKRMPPFDKPVRFVKPKKEY